MQYKTIVLSLIQDHPRLEQRLRETRTYLPVMERYAADLRERHLHWQDLHRRERPQDDPAWIASAALEIAVAELVQVLRAEASPGGSEPTEPATNPTLPE